MLEWLKSMWAKYKVHVSVVGGALVIASIYGQCTFEPDVDAIEEAVEEAADEAAANETTESSATAPAVYTEKNTVTEGATTVNAHDANTESTDPTEATVENTAENQ